VAEKACRLRLLWPLLGFAEWPFVCPPLRYVLALDDATGVRGAMSELRAVIDGMAAREQELLDLLARLVAFPTVSPPARNTTAAQRFLQGYLEELGFTTDLWDVYPGDPNLVGVLKGTQSDRYHSLLINGHIDVAEVGNAEAWQHPPFQLVRSGERVYGRGVADMKGGLAGALFAIASLKRHGIMLRGDLIFQSVVGEEAGEAGTAQCVERGYTADLALVVDTSHLHVQGQGGVITGWITIETPETHHDGERWRMIHAGGGLHGANAIEKMMKVVQCLQELERQWAVMRTYPGFPPGANTINPAVIEGGRHAAFIADRCALWITVHFYPDQDYEDVKKEIESYVLAAAASDPWLREHPPKFRWGGHSMLEERGEIFPALAVNPDHPGVQTLRDAHRSLLGEDPVFDMSATVTDAGWLGRAGIPTVIYGPGELRHAHAVDENLSVEELLAFSQVMAKTIAAWCNRPRDISW
jgi:acetylornithine deacetylase/succinyl-diaminopimelate desuccinylase family protein